MGLTRIAGEVRGPAGVVKSVNFLVDSGATYTVLPEDVWQQIGLTARRRQRFVLADGTFMEREIGQAEISLPQGETATPVILGQPGDLPLLGAVTLEELGLVLNPFRRTLEPISAMLA